MPLARVPGQLFDALVGHAGGRRGRSCLGGPPPLALRAWVVKAPDKQGGHTRCGPK